MPRGAASRRNRKAARARHTQSAIRRAEGQQTFTQSETVPDAVLLEAAGMTDVTSFESNEALAESMAAERSMTIEEAREAVARAAQTFGASGSTDLPLSARDASWDAGAAAKTLSDAQLPKAFFWKDPKGDATAKSTYKLGFATADGDTLTAVWKGVTAAAGAVQGARGGVQIPSGDVAGVKAKIAGYYAKAAKEYDDKNIKPPWEAKDSAGEASATAAAAALAYAECIDGGRGDHAAAYRDRLEFWWDALDVLPLMPEVSPERAALARMREALDAGDPMDGECANADCGHMASSHAGSMNDGACSVEGCTCDAMVPADDNSPEEVAAETAAFVTITEEARQAATDALLEGVEAHGEQRDELVETFRLRLDHFVTSLNEEFDAVPLPAGDTTLPARTPSPGEPDVIPAPTVGGQLKWRASMVPEARLTDDGRAFAPDSLTWRELPLTLMAMVETTEGGHVGALVSGRIDRIWRDADYMIWAEGVFDAADYGTEIGRMVGDGTLRGISVDVAVKDYEVGPRSNWFDDQGNWVPSTDEAANEEVDLLDLLDQTEPPIYLVTEGVIGAATVCPFQAFADARIELAASLCAAASPAVWTFTHQAMWSVVERQILLTGEATGEPGEGIEVALGETVQIGEALVQLTASAEGIAPVKPPAEWFANPNHAELTPLTVTEDGRIFGHAAPWGACHMGIPDVCTVAPHSQTEYAYFLLKEVECEDGSRVPCGTITLEAPHADRTLGRAAAAAHYDNTGTAAADVNAGEDEWGIWVAGALRPDVDAERARDLRGAVLSGDWRNVNGNLELVALLAVNVPGFPIPRTKALVASADDGSRVVLTLIAAGIHVGRVEDGNVVTPEAQAKLDAFRAIASGKFTELRSRAAA